MGTGDLHLKICFQKSRLVTYIISICRTWELEWFSASACMLYVVATTSHKDQ